MWLNSYFHLQEGLHTDWFGGQQTGQILLLLLPKNEYKPANLQSESSLPYSGIRAESLSCSWIPLQVCKKVINHTHKTHKQKKTQPNEQKKILISGFMVSVCVWKGREFSNPALGNVYRIAGHKQNSLRSRTLIVSHSQKKALCTEQD